MSKVLILKYDFLHFITFYVLIFKLQYLLLYNIWAIVEQLCKSYWIYMRVTYLLPTLFRYLDALQALNNVLFEIAGK